MEVVDLDPGTILIAGVGAAVLGSPEARRAIGRGVGWVAATGWRVTRPVVMPVVDAGRDMAGEIRDSAAHPNGGGSGDTVAAPPAGRARRTATASA
jgi:hypothetical protein